MKRQSPSGFTIVETIIFLAASSIILVSAMIFMSGRAQGARFSESMRDINSKMQDWINDIPTGFTGSTAGGVNCIVTGGGKVLINSGVGPNEPECIFLGKAIQFRVDDSKVSAYSVFGRRALGNDIESPLVSSLMEANPEAATGVGASGNGRVVEDYIIKGDAKVKSILSPPSYLAGFYLSFSPTSAKTNGSANLVAYQYPLADGDAPDNAVEDSIRDNKSPAVLTDWQICFESNDAVKTAILTVRATNGVGVTTNLEFKTC